MRTNETKLTGDYISEMFKFNFSPLYVMHAVGGDYAAVLCATQGGVQN